MTYKKKVDPIQRFAENLEKNLNSLNEKENPCWVKNWKDTDTAFRNYEYGKPYRGSYNQVICLLAEKDDPRFLTANQIKKMGGHIKKGSKAISLIAWRPFYKEVEQKDQVTGQTNTVKKKLLFSRVNNVFSIEDVEGIEFKPLDFEPTDVKEDEVISNILEKLGVDYQYSGNQPCYIPSKDIIRMPKPEHFLNQEGYSATFLHELVHWTAKRVKRDNSQYSVDKKARAREELVAEIGSMRLCQILGINGHIQENHLVYIKGWSSLIKEDPRFLYKACTDAEKAAMFILTTADIVEPVIYEDNDSLTEEKEKVTQ